MIKNKHCKTNDLKWRWRARNATIPKPWLFALYIQATGKEKTKKMMCARPWACVCKRRNEDEKLKYRSNPLQNWKDTE